MTPRIGVIGVSEGWSSERLSDVVRERTGFSCLIDLNRVGFDVNSGRVTCDDLDLGTLDALIVKKVGARYSPDLLDRMEILHFLSRTGVPVFSSPPAIMRAVDRISNTLTLRMGDIPVPPTFITESIEEAGKALERYGKAVFKPIYSSKARGMEVIQAGPGAEQAIRRFQDAGNQVMYIQKLVPLPGWDLGIAFLGGQYVGAYARVGHSDSWNTTTHSGGKYQPVEPAPEIIDLAFRAQALFGLDFTSVDVAETPDGPVVFEVSAFGGFRGLLDATGVDAAELYVDYVLAKLGS